MGGNVSTLSPSSLFQASYNPIGHAGSSNSFLGPNGPLSKGGGSGATPPDFVGAARATGEENRANTRLQTQLNRFNSNNPLGSSTWTQGPNDQWTQNITLSPAQQQRLENQQQQNRMRGDIGVTQLNQIRDATANPFSIEGATGGEQAVQDALYRRHSQYLDPQFKEREEAERDRLAGQGFQTGTDGYDRAMSNFGDTRQRAYGDARNEAIIGADNSRAQRIQEALLERQNPMREFLALNGETNVDMPQFQATPGVGQIPGADYLGAANQQNQWNMNQQNANTSTTNAGLGAIGGIAGTVATFF